MPQLNKLSIELLVNAFTAAEGNFYGYFVFAVLGRIQTLKPLSRFIRAMRLPNSGFGSLWGCPLIQEPSIQESSIILACGQRKLPGLSDFSHALTQVLEYSSDLPVVNFGEEAPPEVLGLLVRLT
jgi:hypothetical protein